MFWHFPDIYHVCFLESMQSFGLYYTLEGEPLTPDIMFPSISLFQGMSGSLMLLPSAIMFAINAIISHGRIKKFLGAPEVEDKVKGRQKMVTLAARDTCHDGEVLSF